MGDSGQRVKQTASPNPLVRVRAPWFVLITFAIGVPAAIVPIFAN